MILIDSNALTILIIGLVDENLIGRHNRASIYTKKDFQNLLSTIRDFNNLIVLPNIWTEVDNLLNDFPGNYKWAYINEIKQKISLTTEKYLASTIGTHNDNFQTLGLTDSLILELAKDCEFLITADSTLSDFAMAYNIKVYDMVKNRNNSFN